VFLAAVWIFARPLCNVLSATAVYDAAVLRHLVEDRTKWLTAGMRTITAIGSEGFLLAVVISTGLAFRRQTGSWHPMFALLTIALGAVALERGVKLFVARPRPPMAWRVVRETGLAFPSGHATRSAAVFGSVAYLVTKLRVAKPRVNAAVWITAIVATFFIGISRVYLGVHWPTDVIGGWIIAIAWLWFAFAVAPTHWRRHPALQRVGK
jgi:membrane-associated phospholipid phosphatase